MVGLELVARKRKYWYLVLYTFIICGCSSSSKVNDKNIRYFDDQYNEISRSKFNKIRSTNEFLDIPGDSIHHRKLIGREHQGKLNDYRKFIQSLEEKLKTSIDINKPIVLIYYPGVDACNSSSNISEEWIKNWYGQLEDGVKQIIDVEPLYICKTFEGLESYQGIIDWKEDTDGFVESLFFKNHYSCKSFMVMSTEGEFISYFGEFPKEYVWEATKLML